ncbi:MAG: hypothetical protein PHS77_10715, partial [Gallionellaceae bacterium]|nr:hypothetical protein [Gallionellaceae bacterium]
LRMAAVATTACQTMKFQQLPIGARFEYEGRVYVKTGPVAAAAEQGGQRMIPRHALLRPLDGAPAPATPERGRALDETRVLAAFEAFYAECLRQQDEAGRPALAAARERFLAALA